jgi:3-oxoacyl-[acyl-carrier protein] reductase
MDLGLKGKRVVVSGGTKGIGRAIAMQFAEEGADVGICARNPQQVAETVDALKAKGVNAWGSAVDAANVKAFSDWIGEAKTALGGLDAFVANVSAMSSARTEESWRKSFEIDILSTVTAMETAAKLLEDSKSGAIVFISTTAALETAQGPRPYGAVKAAVINYIKGMARELAPKGIRINTVSPGTIFFEGGVWDQRRQSMPDLYNSMLKANPMGRMGKPEEVANAAVFLASPRAQFISGTNLVVDGAMTQRVQF